MVRHIVMWQFADEAGGNGRAENCRKAKEMLEALPAKIPFIRRLEVGINAYPGAGNADLVLVTEFDSKADLDAYAVNPDHLKVGQFITKVRTSRVACDYDL